MGIFTEHDDGSFSWRKVIAFFGLMIFIAYNVNIILRHNPMDVPPGVKVLIAIIFGFYFGKASIGYAFKAIKNKITK